MVEVGKPIMKERVFNLTLHSIALLFNCRALYLLSLVVPL